MDGISANSGRLEVFYEGYWGRVCGFTHPGHWDDSGADIVCRQLGYATGIASIQAYQRSGTGLVRMFVISCSGVESSLLRCQHAWRDILVTECIRHDAGVICSRGGNATRLIVITILDLLMTSFNPCSARTDH